MRSPNSVGTALIIAAAAASFLGGMAVLYAYGRAWHAIRSWCGDER